MCRCMKLWKNPTASNDSRNTKPLKAVPGSTGYKATYGNENDDDGKVTVNMSNIVAKWVNLRRVGSILSVRSGESMPLAILPSQSVLNVAAPNTDHIIFGVAQNVVLIGNGASVVFCSGVSLLPPGSLWLQLALKCVGKSDVGLLDGCKKSSYQVPSELQIELAEHISDVILDLCDAPLQPSTPLLQGILKLFERWLMDEDPMLSQPNDVIATNVDIANPMKAFYDMKPMEINEKIYEEIRAMEAYAFLNNNNGNNKQNNKSNNKSNGHSLVSSKKKDKEISKEVLSQEKTKKLKNKNKIKNVSTEEVIQAMLETGEEIMFSPDENKVKKEIVIKKKLKKQSKV